MRLDRDAGPNRDLKERLRSLYLSEGVLRHGPQGPIVSTDGQSARWMIDSLSFSLTSNGSALAADALLGLLEQFEGRQLATYGTIGLPLMQAVVLRSKGRYRGLIVRKEVKAYGARKRVEGKLDPHEPVVLIDDSITSGNSMSLCARYLREAGLEVEGGVFLTRFGFEGVSRLQAELGVPIKVLFDVERDFYSGIPGETPYALNGLKTLETLPWSKQRLPDALDPCTAARRVIEHWLSTGRALLPPKRFDASAPHQGGTFVSLRHHHDIHHRPARSGFWHLPGERPRSQTEDLVWAAVQTAEELKKSPRARALLDQCGVAVTTFSQLEKVPLAKVDDRQHGVVVRSLERPWVLGGGLPRMPGLRNAWELFAHAAFRNAQLLPTERFELFRHQVFKRVEEGTAWQPTGVPLVEGALPEEHAREVEPLLRRALAEVEGFLGGDKPEGDEPGWPEGVEQLYLSFFRGGRLQGCMGTQRGEEAASLRDLARAVVSDHRFEHGEGEPAVVLSFLRNRQGVGDSDPEWMARVTRYGEQAIEVEQEDRSALLLPAVVSYQGYDRQQFAEAVITKAQLRAPPYHFALSDVVSWSVSSRGVVKMRGAVSEHPALSAVDLSAALLRFLERTHSNSGEPYVRYLVYQDVLKTDRAGHWLAHRAWVKHRLGLTKQAREDLGRFRLRGLTLSLGREPCGVAEYAFNALAWLELGQPKRARPLLQRLLNAIDATGCLAGPEGDEQDFFPYQALLAFAAAVKRKVLPRSDTLDRAFAHYRRRWRGNHAWGSYAWAAQAFTAWGLAVRDDAFLQLAREVVLYGLDSQSETDGCFFTGLETDPPSAMTAVYLEAVAAGLNAARALGDEAFGRRCQRSFERGLTFLSSLVVTADDRPFVPNFWWAEGGLRTHAGSDEARLDYVQHALSALHIAEHGVFGKVKP